MDRLERIQLIISKGYTYDPITGKIFNIKGNEITYKDNKGYIRIAVRIGERKHNKVIYIFGHQFAWYILYGTIVDRIDHINFEKVNPYLSKSDNRQCNLRVLTHQQNLWNNQADGYSWNKKAKKYKSQIGINGESLYLGYFDTKEEAHQSYLDAKNKYHII